MFERRRFPVEIILLCVRWYCKYGISYRDLTEMMQERGVEVDPSTIMRWVHRYAPELEKRVRAYQGYGSTSWRVDEMRCQNSFFTNKAVVCPQPMVYVVSFSPRGVIKCCGTAETPFSLEFT